MPSINKRNSRNSRKRSSFSKKSQFSRKHLLRQGVILKRSKRSVPSSESEFSDLLENSSSSTDLSSSSNESSNTDKIIKHILFTEWMSKSVPNIELFVKFIDKLYEDIIESKGNIIIQSLSGNGRTGVVYVVLSLLFKGKTSAFDKIVNDSTLPTEEEILYEIIKAKEYRNNTTVENVEQYKFICKYFGIDNPTEENLKLFELATKKKNIRSNFIEKCTNTYVDKCNIFYNRKTENLPNGKHLVTLTNTVINNECSDYIDASIMKPFIHINKKGQFIGEYNNIIICSSPINDLTYKQFYRMLIEKNIKLIIMIQDSKEESNNSINYFNSTEIDEDENEDEDKSLEIRNININMLKLLLQLKQKKRSSKSRKSTSTLSIKGVPTSSSTTDTTSQVIEDNKLYFVLIRAHGGLPYKENSDVSKRVETFTVPNHMNVHKITSAINGTTNCGAYKYDFKRSDIKNIIDDIDKTFRKSTKNNNDEKKYQQTVVNSIQKLLREKEKEISTFKNTYTQRSSISDTTFINKPYQKYGKEKQGEIIPHTIEVFFMDPTSAKKNEIVVQSTDIFEKIQKNNEFDLKSIIEYLDKRMYIKNAVILDFSCSSLHVEDKEVITYLNQHNLHGGKKVRLHRN